MTDETAAEAAEAPTTEHADTDETSTQYGVGPFTVREIAIIGGWLIAFVVSFFSISTVRFDSVWTNGILWILTIGVPTVAVFLIVLRRFSPDGIRRVGSLGIDQFASVAFSVSAVLWLQLLWETIAFVVAGGQWLRGWVVWVELAVMIALVVLTVFAPLIPSLCDDFQGRPASAAHRNARPVRRVIARPRPERPVEPEADDAYAAFAGTGAFAEPSPYGAQPAPYGAEPSPYGAEPAPYGAERTPYTAEPAPYAAAQPSPADHEEWAPAYARSGGDAATQEFAGQPVVESAQAPPPAQQAFWALTPVERDVVDDRGIPIYRIGPTAWALVIEDRGEVFVVRHEDGRIGYLHDVSGVTRG